MLAFDKRSSSLGVIHETLDGRADQRLLNEIAVREFHLSQRSPDVAVAVAAIKALTQVIRHSSATTLMGLVKEVEEAASALQKVIPTGEAKQQNSMHDCLALITSEPLRSAQPESRVRALSSVHYKNERIGVRQL